MVSTESLNLKKFYKEHPYPSNKISTNLVYDIGLMLKYILDTKTNKAVSILDLGCGTGHRLIGAAKLFPNSSFLGVDISEEAIEIAKKLVVHNKLKNIDFVCSDIKDVSFSEEFDVVTSTGVFQHMENPASGLKKAFNALKSNGILYIWTFHIIGEYYRLVDREFVQLFLQNASENKDAISNEILSQLDLSIDQNRYGTVFNKSNYSEYENQIINADAYLNPIVNAFDFNDIDSLLKEAGFFKTQLVGFNRLNESKVINFKNQNSTSSLDIDALFNSNKKILSIFNSLSYSEKVRALELKWKPTGISCVGIKTPESNTLLSNNIRLE